MKVLGIVGSPRLHGNTEILVQTALNKAADEGAQTEMLLLGTKTIAPCDGCRSCYTTGFCHIKDDMQEIYPKLLEADGFIFGSPVYFYGVTAQVKALMDRTYCLKAKLELRNKAAGVVVTENSTGASSVLAAFNGFFSLQRMIMVGKANGIGGPKKGQITGDQRAMSDAAAVGYAVVGFVKSRAIPL